MALLRHDRHHSATGRDGTQASTNCDLSLSRRGGAAGEDVAKRNRCRRRGRRPKKRSAKKAVEATIHRLRQSSSQKRLAPSCTPLYSTALDYLLLHYRHYSPGYHPCSALGFTRRSRGREIIRGVYIVTTPLSLNRKGRGARGAGIAHYIERRERPARYAKKKISGVYCFIASLHSSLRPGAPLCHAGSERQLRGPRHEERARARPDRQQRTVRDAT